MKLPWSIRARIAASAVIGILVVGLPAVRLAWHDEPHTPFSAAGGAIDLFDAVILAGLAVVAGLAAFLVSWPYGRQIGPLAVPCGLTVVAFKSGPMSAFLQQTSQLAQRKAFFTTLAWEPMVWLAVLAAGFGGVGLGLLIKPRSGPDGGVKPAPARENVINCLIAIAGSVAIAHLCITVLAQGVRFPDSRLGSVLAQPAGGQIVFAVVTAFAAAAFLVKKLLDMSYIWPVIATALLPALAARLYATEQTLQHLAENWPPAFFPSATMCVWPAQMAGYGAVGAMAGYWLAVRYSRKQKHNTAG
jgi:hypothetical protein